MLRWWEPFQGKPSRDYNCYHSLLTLIIYVSSTHERSSCTSCDRRDLTFHINTLIVLGPSSFFSFFPVTSPPSSPQVPSHPPTFWTTFPKHQPSPSYLVDSTFASFVLLSRFTQLINMVQELERLRDLPLRGFDEIDEDTPSSGTASLPTPLLNAEELHANPVTLLNATPLAAQEPAVELVRPPGAPLLKDYDSFTEGSRAGSFDFLSSASGDLCYPLNTTHTEMMGESSNTVGLTISDITHLDDDDDDASMSIEQWRANVASDAPSYESSLPLPSSTPAKRPRSPTPEGVRRIRPRARSLSSTSSAANDFDWFAPLPEVIERPPSRASSAPD